MQRSCILLINGQLTAPLLDTHLVHSPIKGSRCYSYLSDVNKIGTFLPVLPPASHPLPTPEHGWQSVCVWATLCWRWIISKMRKRQHPTVAGWNEDSILNEWDVQLAATTSVGKLGASCWTRKEILKPYYSASKWTFSVARPQIKHFGFARYMDSVCLQTFCANRYDFFFFLRSLELGAGKVKLRLGFGEFCPQTHLWGTSILFAFHSMCVDVIKLGDGIRFFFTPFIYFYIWNLTEDQKCSVRIFFRKQNCSFFQVTWK